MTQETKPAETTAPNQESKPSGSRLRRYLLRGLLGVVATPVVLVGFLHTPPGEALLRARVEQRLGERVGTKATVGALKFSLAKGIDLEKIAIWGNDQKEAITVEKVTIVPGWQKTLGGTPTLESLSVHGVRVDVRAKEDGRTNLTAVFLEKKSVEHVVIQKLDVGEVGFSLTKPDGTKVAVSGVSLGGSVDAKPNAKAFAVDLALGVAQVDFEKPGTKVAARELATKVHVALVAGSGDVTFGPTSGNVELSRDGKKPYPVVLGLPPVSLRLAPGELNVAAEALKIAALSLAVVKAEVRRTPEGELQGEQKLELTTFKIEAEAVNTLAEKKLLASDVTLDVRAHGPPEKLGLGLTLGTAGGTLKLDGTLDAKEKAFSATLSTRNFDVRRVVAVETVPEIRIGALVLTASGKGKDQAALDARFALHLEKTTVKDVAIERLDVSGTYANRVVTLDSVAIDALGQEVRGDVRYEPETKNVAANVSTKGSLGVTLAALKQAGIATPSSPFLASVSIARPVKLRIDGTTDKGLSVHVDDLTLGAVGGMVHATGRVSLVAGDPSKGEKRFRADTIDTTLVVEGLSLDTVGRLRGKPLPVSGTVSGKVHVTGPVASPDADFTLGARLADGAGRLAIDGTSRSGAVNANVKLEDREGRELLRTVAKGHIAQKTLSSGAPLSLSVDVPKRPLSDFAPLLSAEMAQKLPNATASIHAEISGTAARPTGEVHIVVEGALVKALAPATQKADIALHLEPVPKGSRLTAKAEISALEGSAPVLVVASAELLGPLGQARTAPLTWTADVTVPETSLGALPLPADKKDGLAGKAKVTVHAHGTRKDVAADLFVGLAGFAKGPVRGIDANLEAHLDDQHTTATLASTFYGTPLVNARAEAALGGKDLLVRKLDDADPEVDVRLEMPRTALTKFVPLAPSAANLGGTVTLRGHARNPALEAKFAAEGLRTAAGGALTTTLDLEGNLDLLRMKLGLGTGLVLSASVPPRAYLSAKNGEGTVPVMVAITAPKAPLPSILPSLRQIDPYRFQGTFFSDLVANVNLHVKGEERSVESIDVRGSLRLGEGRVAIPDSTRALDGVAFALRGEGASLVVEGLAAHEHDREKANRSVSGSGKISLDTRTVDLAIDAHDMLVFGGNFGQPDAPRAAMTGKLGVHADLAPKVKRVDVRIESLELLSPDRFPRAHEQEVLSLGDVVDLGSGVGVGKLARSRVAEPPKESSEPKGERTLEVYVHVPNLIHVKQKPLDLFARGEIAIVRTTDGRTLSGTLACEKGSLMVGGIEHTLDHGEVRMTSDGPFLDLHFKREPHPAALRDFATGSGTSLYAHMIGPFGRQKISFSGVADGLFEALAVNNGGRTRVLSSPDAPASQTAQLPQVRELRLTAYMAANLPHLAFLNRMNTTADPYAGRFAYGRFQTLEAERYSADGTRRLRTTSRVPVIGQSEGEVEYDYLFQNTSQVVSGVGVVGGTRAGGGPAVFWEWSSKE